MTMLRANGAPILTPAQVGDLLVTPLLAASIAAQVCTVVQTDSPAFRVPRVVSDPTTAWVREGQEISPSDAVLDEVEAEPRKLAGLTIITSELADDSDPAALQVVGDGLARDLARKVDTAFFGNLAAPAPAGLGSVIADATTVYAGTSWAGLDSFAAGVSAAEQLGATMGAWVTSPSDALALAQLKTATGSNLALLSAQAGQPARRIVEGLPLLVSPAVPTGTVWGIPADRTYLVLRKDAEVTNDRSVFYTSDRVAVRAITRVGFAFAHREALVRIVVAPTDPTA